MIVIYRNHWWNRTKWIFIFSAAFMLHFVSFLFLTSTYAYERPVHVKITQQAISQATNYLSFMNDFRPDSDSADEGIKNGSFREDDIPRFIHHFYDPQNGQGICPVICVPSLEWGLNDTDNDYSWAKARNYMYQALTGGNGATRSASFSKMFRSVGRVMHLVQDLATPAHVRNDSHFKLPYSLVRDLYENYTLSHYSSSWATGYPTVGLNNFSDPWTSSFGLSFFTNQNFISQDTNFFILNSTVQTVYPLPRLNHFTSKTEFLNLYNGNTFPIEVDYGGNTIQDLNTGETIVNDRLTAFSVFDFEAQQQLGERVFSINDFTMESAANILVRRAVGYSAGLLDYFFRGQLHVMLLVPATDVLSTNFGNENDTGPDIDTISLFVQNRSTLNGQIEPIGNGTLTLMYSYQNSLGSTLYGTAGSVVVPGIPHVLDASSFSILFSLPQPIPHTASDLTYYLTFRGQLGNEADAVIGKAIKAPMLHNVSPEKVVEGTMITLTGDQLGFSEVVFEHDLTKPYSAPVLNQDNVSIRLPVPNNAGVVKLSYGGIRVRNILNTGEKVYSNPVSYFPTAQGVIKNLSTRFASRIRIEALRPVFGDYSQLPPTFFTNRLDHDQEEPMELELGFIYNFGAEGQFEKPVTMIRPGEDFIITNLLVGFSIDLRD